MGAGEALSFAESRLESALLSPLPSTQTADSDTVDLEKRTYGKAPNQFRCVMVGPKMKETNSAPVGLFPTYCFSLTQPALIGYVAYAAPTIEFSHIARTQNRYLPMQITILSPDRKKLLTASVNGVSGISVSDPALTPPTEAKIFYPPKKKAPAVSAEAPAAGASETDKTEDKLDYDATDNHMVIPSGVMQGKALKRPTPIYPDDAKRDRITGKVVIQAVIGTDGWIHDMRVLTTPSASLAASALGAVSQWQYLPYQLNGEPVEVETTVNVVYDIR